MRDIKNYELGLLIKIIFIASEKKSGGEEAKIKKQEIKVKMRGIKRKEVVGEKREKIKSREK